MERTLALIKPDAVGAGKADEICDRIRAEGYTIVQRKAMTLTRERAEEFYAEHKERGFFGELVEFMCSGPINAMILEKKGAILGWRALMGPTNTFTAKEQEPNSLRALYGTGLSENATHGSDSTESAARELQFFFPSGVKLYYWPMKGRAAPLRIALHMSGIDFEDYRFPRSETGELKASGISPFQQFPVLEVDGEVMAQTNSILRWIGRQGGLYPSDPVDALTVDMMLENCEDLTRTIVPTFHMSDPEEVQKMRTHLYQNVWPAYFKLIETTISNSGSSGYLLGDEITIADIKLAFVLGWYSSGVLDHVPTTVLDAYPKSKKLVGAVMTHPKVEEWDREHEK